MCKVMVVFSRDNLFCLHSRKLILNILSATVFVIIHCSRRAGVKLEVLHRAEQLQKCFSQNKVIHPLQQPPAEPSSSEQQQRQHPNPNPNYLLNDFSSQV